MVAEAARIPTEQITGLIIAGGLARRMEGRHKGLQLYRGQPLLAHVAARLAPQVGSMLLNVNHDAAAYRDFNLPLVADLSADYAGPLAGLLAGLKACQTPWLACVPCDAPHLPEHLVASLATAVLQQSADSAHAVAVGRAQPLFLLCRRQLAASLADYLARGGRKFETWLAEVRALPVDFADAAAFDNINTLAELAAANARAVAPGVSNAGSISG